MATIIHRTAFAALLVGALAVTSAHCCPPLIERDWTMRGPGGCYGYMDVSWNNQLRQQGQPQRIHQHVILLGPVSFDITRRRGPMVGGIAVAAAALVGFGWWLFGLHKD